MRMWFMGILVVYLTSALSGCSFLGKDERILVVYNVQSGAVEYKQEFVSESACRKVADNPTVLEEGEMKMVSWNINGETYTKIRLPKEMQEVTDGRYMGHGVKCIAGDS